MTERESTGVALRDVWMDAAGRLEGMVARYDPLFANRQVTRIGEFTAFATCDFAGHFQQVKHYTVSTPEIGPGSGTPFFVTFFPDIIFELFRRACDWRRDRSCLPATRNAGE